MHDRALAALFVLAVWWLSTGAVLALVWLRRATYRFSVGAVSVVALGGLAGLFLRSRSTGSADAYFAFGCALSVWAWHELTFLLGMVTGPRKTPCPLDSRGWRRVFLATSVVIYHEVALAVTLLVIVALTWGARNQVGTSTFFVLWIMRLSAKLNVFLGVRNLTEEFVPEHLRYIVSYFRRSNMNALMPFSLLIGGAAAVRLCRESFAAGSSDFDHIGRTLVASLLALGVVEHAFLALPVPDALLWRWAIRRPPVTPKEPTTISPIQTSARSMEPLRRIPAESP